MGAVSAWLDGNTITRSGQTPVRNWGLTPNACSSTVVVSPLCFDASRRTFRRPARSTGVARMAAVLSLAPEGRQVALHRQARPRTARCTRDAAVYRRRRLLAAA